MAVVTLAVPRQLGTEMLSLETKIRLTATVLKKANLTSYFTEDDLKKIGAHVFEGYTQDKQSRNVWERRTEAAMNLAMQIVEAKNFPWDNCANVAFPLVTIAALQFHSRAYPAILPGNQIVRYKIEGEDKDGSQALRAARIGSHMSWQFMEEDTAWEEQHDRMLLSVPIVGCAFKKSYNNGEKNTSELVLARDLVLDYYAKSVETCTRKTQLITQYRNEIYTNVRSDVYRNILEEAWYTANATVLSSTQQHKKDHRTGVEEPTTTEDTPFTFLEQHCWLDLDGDGYREPYIVTIEHASQAVVRITSRADRESDIVKDVHGKIVSIRATEYYTKYSFIPSPDGSIYDLGFGVLLGSLNETTNTLLNQLLDAGTMATTAGGFLGRGAKLRGGSYSFAPREWKRVDSTGDDLRKSIVPLEVREPSLVLFQLLSLLINYTGRIAGTTDTVMGENPGQNTPAQTTQTMVEQGTKVYNAIYKRIWRSMKEEFRKHYVLNAIYMPVHKLYGPKGSKAIRDDYLADPSLVSPVADPSLTTESMQLQQALMLKQAAAATPGYNTDVVERKFLRAIRVEDIDTVFVGTASTPPRVDPKVQIEQMKIEMEKTRLQFEQMKFVLEMQEQISLDRAKILELSSKAALNLEKADGVKEGQQIAAFSAAIGAMKTKEDMLQKRLMLLLERMDIDNEKGNLAGGVSSVGGEPSDAGTAQVSGEVAV